MAAVCTRGRANHIHVWGEAPHESRRVWNKPLHCKVPDPLLREGVARETTPTPCTVISVGMVTVRYVDIDPEVFWGRLNKISDVAGAKFNVPCSFMLC